MRYITKTLPWTYKAQWAWPDIDKKLIQVFDHVSDINLIMKYVDEPKVCIQAGGACGIWPLRFSLNFEVVYTFEPLSDNYECLIENTRDAGNIVVSHLALSNQESNGEMVLDHSELNNSGAFYFKPGEGDIKTTLIDNLLLTRCDLIQLDIEGHELAALQGAIETISEYKPVIVIEEKALPQLKDYTKPREFLESLGYKEIDRIHRDVIFNYCG